MALSFILNFKYVLATDDQGDTYIVAEELVEQRREGDRAASSRPRPDHFPGSSFAHAKFQHPFLDRVVPGVLGEHVTLEQGSGIVHTAPGHGADDFRRRPGIWPRDLRAAR